MRDRILEVTGSSDAELVARVRAGDNEAFADLYDRHQEAAHRLARQLTRGGDSDDLVSEAFTRVLMLLQGGGGPDVAFRAYLLTAVRRLYVDRLRGQQRVHTTDDVTEFDPGIPFQDTAVDQFERRTTARAFASLPERWQLVLWHLDVERQKPAEVAPLLGLSANSVSALAYRAREGLRQAYLQMHLADTEDQVCRWTTERLGAYVRDNLARRESRQVRQHLEECPRCTAVYLELAEVNSNLRGVLAPLLLGAAGTGYLASTPGGGAAGTWSLVSRATEVVKAGGSSAVGAGAAGTAAAAAVTLALVIGSSGSPSAEPGARAAERSVTSPATTERGEPGERGEPAGPAAGTPRDDRRVSSLLARPGVLGSAGTAIGRPGAPRDDAPQDRRGQEPDADARGKGPESDPAGQQSRAPGSDADAPGSDADAPGSDADAPGSDRGDGGPRGEGPRGDGPGGDEPRGDGPGGDGPGGDEPRGDGPSSGGDGPPPAGSDPGPGQPNNPNPPHRDQDPPDEPGNGSDNSGSGNSGSGGGSDNSGPGGGSDDDENRDSDEDRDDRSRDDRRRGSDDDSDDRSRDDRKGGSDDDCQPGKGDDKGRGEGLEEGHGRGNDCDRD